MSGEHPESDKKKTRSGPSGWKKYDAMRFQTGKRIDPYVRSHAPQTAVAGTLAQVSTDQQKLGPTAIVERTSAETSVLAAVSGSARQEHAAADPSSTAIVPAEGQHAKRSDSAVAERIRPSQDSAVAQGVTIHVATPSQESAVAEGVTIHAATPSQEPAVAEGVPLHVATPSQGSAVAAEASRRSIGVGEHLSGEAFLWRGIWDMP